MTDGRGPAGPTPRADQLCGFRIGVTSDRRSEDLIAALQRRGAQVLHAPALKMVPQLQEQALVQEARTVIAGRPDYRWEVNPPGDGVARLVELLARRELDAVTFTSAPAVAAVLDVARALGRLDAVCEALRTDVLAAVVGPVTAVPLIEVGVRPVRPDRSRMGALIRLVCDQLEQYRVVRLRAGEVTLELRGRCLRVGDRNVLLGPSALALFRALVASDTVVPRADLLRRLGGCGDAHALEVAVSRLRRSLAVPDLITTVVRRGYLLNATRRDG